MSIPNIEDIIPEGPIRKLAYRVFAVLGLVLFLTQVGYLALPGNEQPAWLTVALAVFAPLAAAGFAKAQANTPLVPVAPLPHLAVVEATPISTEQSDFYREKSANPQVAEDPTSPPWSDAV